MCSYSTTRILFFILLQLTGIYSTEEVSLENDITKYIDKWVNSVFTIGGKSIATMISPIYGSKWKFEHNISNQENNFHKKFIFQKIDFHKPCLIAYDGKKPQQIMLKFFENKIIVFFEELNIDIGDMVVVVGLGTSVGNNGNPSIVDVHATFKNFTSTALKSCKKGYDLNITYDFTCSSVDYWHENWWHSRGSLSDEDRNLLDREIKAILPNILRKTLNNNQTFSYELDDVFQKYEKPRQEIISIHPDFLSNPYKYYYLIPKIPFFCFILKRVVIHGLSNFESYEAHGEQGIFTHSLLIRNIQGSMTLDYPSEKEKPLKLNFQIDCFFLSKKGDADCVQVRAKYYTITRRKTNTSLSGRQSEVIINRLETVLASGLFGLSPKEIGRICNLEIPLEKIKISNSSDWKSIKESYKGWIPFNNEDEIEN